MKEQLVCALAQLAAELGTSGLVGLIGAVGAASTLLAAIGRRIAALRPKGSAAPGPPWLMATLIAIGIYALARLVDPLLAHDLGPAPLGVGAERWATVGYFESVLLGSSWAGPLLPLADHPAIAVMIHAALWPLMVLLIHFVLVRWPSSVRTVGVDVRYDTPDAALPRWWIGATTPRRADDRFKRWSMRLLFMLVPLHLTAGGLMAVGQRGNPVPTCGGIADGLPTTAASAAGGLGAALDAGGLGGLAMDVGHPAPGIWILGGLLLTVWSLHLLLPGRPQSDPEPEDEEEKEEGTEEEVVATDLLTKLGTALGVPPSDEEVMALQRLGRELELGAPSDAAPGKSEALPEGVGPMVREVLASLTGVEELWSHQAAVLRHLVRAWQVDGGRGEGATPTLEEEVARSPVRASRVGAPHALLAAAELSGRSTVAMLAAVHVALDRGGSTLVVLPQAADTGTWATTFREAVQRSPARWSVTVVEAGDALATMLLGGEVPTVVVTDIARLDASVLADARAEPFLDRLALVVADDVDGQVGIAEMHLHLLMRRLWALDESRRALMEERGFPTLLLAITGPEPRRPGEGIGTGRASWARHLLATPLQLFAESSGAPRAARLVLRRGDLRSRSGGPPSREAMAEACAEAGLVWKTRRAGDGQRQLRASGESDARQAEVIWVEGPHLDALREAVRLLHAGAATEDRAAILVLDSPPFEAVVLHQQASDGEPLTGLPRPASVVEPRVLRQRHLERALGRPHEREALRRRLGGDLGDAILERLERTGQVRSRQRHLFDPQRDAPVVRAILQTSREQPLGEPIDPDCVGDVEARVELVDEGTATVLARVDGAVAPALHPPGSLFEHPMGTYVVLEGASAEDRRIRVDRAGPSATTSVIERVVDIDEPDDAALGETLEPRALGGRPTGLGLVRVQLTERVLGVRRHGEAGEIEDERQFDAPPIARYATDACLVRTPLDEGSAATLLCACRFALQTALRGTGGLADVNVVAIGSAWNLVFYDRVPGGGGFAATLARDGLRPVLVVARLALERLAHDALESFRDRWDSRPRERRGEWNARAALTWLDGLLDRERERRRSAHRGYTPGEGQRGDLGRLWVGRSGTATDLAWTRHRWDSPVPLDDGEGGTIPPGDVFFDAGIERSMLRQRREGDAESLAPWVELIEGRSAENHGVSALHLVAAIPTRPREDDAPPPDPVQAFFTRRADAETKARLLRALVPSASAWVDEEGRVAVEVDGRFWDLDGPTPRALHAFAGGPLGDG